MHLPTICAWMSIAFCVYLPNFATPSLPPEDFLLCNKNSPQKHLSFQDDLKCQPQRLHKMESCSATIFSFQATLRKIQAYFCFTKEIRWTTHFYFFGSKFKESKTVDGSPPGHLICNSWKFTKSTRDGKFMPLPGLQNFQNKQ